MSGSCRLARRSPAMPTSLFCLAQGNARRSGGTAGGGLDIDLAAHVRRGGAVLGICGGLQMLGRRVADPTGIEAAWHRRGSRAA